MEIDGSNPLIGLDNGVRRLDAPLQQERAPRDGRMHGDSDRLELSIRGLEISHFEELMQAIPDIRDERVAQILGEIERGMYNVKAERIAEKIIGGCLLDEIC